MEAGSPSSVSKGRDSRQARTADTRGIQDMGLEMGPGRKSAAALQRQHDEHLQTLEFATCGEHTKQVDAGEDESDARGTRLGVLSQ